MRWVSAKSSLVTVSSSYQGYYYGSAAAPACFGKVGGDVLIVQAGSKNAILALSPSSNLSTFVFLSNFGADLQVAPTGFVKGSTAPELLVSDIGDGNIYSIDENGNEKLYATVPLSFAQTGLRNMVIAPGGFVVGGLNLSGDLVVSVSGSNAGGGTYGSVDVLDPAGDLVAKLNQGTVDAPFDPRGLYFESANQLLIANADPSILSGTPADFTAVPEPSTFGGHCNRSRLDCFCAAVGLLRIPYGGNALLGGEGRSGQPFAVHKVHRRIVGPAVACIARLSDCGCG